MTSAIFSFFFGGLMGIVWLGLAMKLAPKNEYIAFVCGLFACLCDLWFVGVLR